MAVGNTINVSIPVVGTTVETYTRSNGNQFSSTAYTISSVDYPATLNVRPANALGTSRRFGISTRVRPSDQNDPGTVTKGSCAVSINVDAQIGSAMTATELAKFIRHSLSAALHSNLIEDLSNGVAL